MESVNPYELLGVNSNSTLKELKNNYYSLALYCHPDKGGSEKDMITLKNCYNYIKIQLENHTDKTYEELEKDFEIFCKDQESKPPKFCKIFSETHEEWSNTFNTNFTNNKYSNLFDSGYGNLMDSDKNINEDYSVDIKGTNANKFKTEIVVHNQPEPLPINVDHNTRLDLIVIDDYSYNDMADYKLAFSDPINLDQFYKEPDLKEILKERQGFLPKMLIIYGTSKTSGNYFTAKRLQFHFPNSIIHNVNDSLSEIKFDHILAINASRTCEFIENSYKPYSIILSGTDTLDNYVKNKNSISKIIKKAQNVITFNLEMMERGKKLYNIDNIKIIPQAVDISYNEEIIDIKYDYYLWIGELRDIKNINLFLEIANKYNQFKYLIIGKSNENLILDNLPNNVKYLGELKRNTVLNYIIKSKGLINTSIEEGMSDTILSSMALGCPVICKNNSGNSSIINNLKNGYLFNNINELENIFYKDNNKVILSAKNYIYNNHSISDEHWKYKKLFS
jgi:glycosyltransferase involved in cell wall biosynthesis